MLHSRLPILFGHIGLNFVDQCLIPLAVEDINV